MNTQRNGNGFGVDSGAYVGAPLARFTCTISVAGEVLRTFVHEASAVYEATHAMDMVALHELGVHAFNRTISIGETVVKESFIDFVEEARREAERDAWYTYEMPEETVTETETEEELDPYFEKYGHL